MIDHGNKRINILDKKREYLIDKINAYFNRVKEDNPIKCLRKRIEEFNELLDRGLEVFK